MAFGIVLVDTSGTTRALDGSLGVSVPLGSRGMSFPSITPNGDKLPYAPGVALRRVSTAPGVLDLPLILRAATSAALDTIMDNIRGWILPGTERNATPDTVYIRVTRDDGAVREIEGVARLSEGDDSAGGPILQRAILSLYCHEAYWRDVTATTVTFTSGTGVRSWFPYWPYDLTPSAIFSEETITNSGQIETWPVWTITGPGSDPTVTNLTTGETLVLSGLTLAAGDVVTIDTSESGATAKTITDANGVNLWPYATTASALWPLEVGANVVRVELDGATGASSVELSYRRRWAGGHR